MATIPKTGITNGQTIQASQITNIIDALDGTTSNELIIDGAITASAGITGSITNAISSSYAVSSSHAASSLTASYALNGGGSGPDGANGYVQYYNNGSFGSSDNFIYNSSNDMLSFGTGSLGEIQFNIYHIKQVGDSIIFNQGQEDVGTTIQGFGGSTSITLGDGTLGLGGSTINIGPSAGSAVNIGTGASTTTTIGGSTAGTITINNGGTINLGTTAQTVNLGASTSRIQLSNNQIRNASQAYFYGNSGTEAFNVGTSTTTTNNLHSRAYITVSSTTSQLGLRAQAAGTNYINFTAYDGYSAIESVNGKPFYINNNVLNANVQFGSSTSANGKVVVYTAGIGSIPNALPGQSNGAYGGLYVAHNLQLGGAYGYKASGTTWSNPSDERVKENIVTASLETCYETVKNIPLKRFNYTENYSETPLYDVNQLGWIAQEVATQFPKSIISSSFTTWTTYTGSEAVTGSNGNIVEPGDRVQDTSLGSQTIENFLSLDSDQIIKIMFGAIQHLQAKVEALESN